MDALSQAGYTLTTHMARYPALAVGLPLIGGFLSSLPIRSHVKEQYNSFDRPAWAPPAYLFAPAWTTLYVSIGYASHLVALKTGPSTSPGIHDLARTGLLVYGGNLVLNFAWSPLMFWKRKYGTALVTASGLTVSALLSSCRNVEWILFFLGDHKPEFETSKRFRALFFAQGRQCAYTRVHNEMGQGEALTKISSCCSHQI